MWVSFSAERWRGTQVPGFFSLYVVWQTGVALCIGLLLPVRNRTAEPPVRPA
jgi:hypothetical protein